MSRADAALRRARAARLRDAPRWDAFVRGRLLREEDVARLMKIADVARDANDDDDDDDDDARRRRAREARATMRATMKHHGRAVCETLLGTLSNVGATAATEHVLALVEAATGTATTRDDDECDAMDARDRWLGVDALVNYDPETCEDEVMAAIGGAAEADAYRVLAKTLARPEDANSRFIKETASRTLRMMIARRPRDGAGGAKAASVAHAVRTIVSWCGRELRARERGDANGDDVVPSVASALAGVLDVPEARALATNERIVEGLTPILRASDRFSVQTMYEVALCFWLMSFSAEGRREMCARGAASVKALMSCAGAATKEKVIRACILALKNITDRHGVDGDAVGDNFTAVDESLRKLVHNLSLRGFEDEELASTLAELDEDLRARRKEASSWERYRDEVMSGSLEWSAAHKDEGFWRECATKLTDNNCQILRVLIKLIDGSEAMDPKTLAVACNDIGEFAVHYPAGRFLANDLGGKEHSMRLMSHEDDEVRKSALQCVQKLLVASWRSLGAASE